VKSKFNIQHDFHVLRIDGNIKNMIGSQLELLQTYEEVLEDSLYDENENNKKLIECRFWVVFSSRKRERTPSPEQDTSAESDHQRKRMKYVPWTTEDNVKLRTAIFRLGFGSWRKIQEEYFPERSYNSIRSHAEKNLKDEESACDKELLDRRLMVTIAADTAKVARIALESSAEEKEKESLSLDED
jgi:hypothetical protein